LPKSNSISDVNLIVQLPSTDSSPLIESPQSSSSTTPAGRPRSIQANIYELIPFNQKRKTFFECL
jgi:hypothetical protein